MSDQGIYEPIPQPPGYPMLGNLFDLRGAETPIQALMKLARQYGPIFRLHVGPRRFTVVSSFVRPQPSPVVVLGALLFILGSTLIALDVFRGSSRGSAAGKAIPDDPTRETTCRRHPDRNGG